MSNYSELFSISIMHTYYSDEVCPDFTLEPTPSSYDILKNHRIVLKNRTGSLQLAVPTGDNPPSQPFIDLSAIKKVSFYMKLHRETFSYYTDLPEITRDEMYYYGNFDPCEEDLTEEIIKKKAVELPMNDGGIFGMADIFFPDSFDLNSPPNYIISFQAKEIEWSYYFIINKNTPPSVPKVTVTDTSGQIIFSTGTGDAEIIAELKKRYPNSHIHFLRSDAPVSYQEKGRAGIQLLVGDDPLIEHLPNPSTVDNGIQILRTPVSTYQPSL
ncbi:MAG: hypothetical protein GKR88_10860 [Flavobacteriaceae bacterium]|nr:MAG: hypothetical protein GKR88_10860 [Flavobacteriaceae bacterium]